MPILGLLFTCFTGGGLRAHTYANPTHSVTIPGQLQMAIQLSECMNSLRTIAVSSESKKPCSHLQRSANSLTSCTLMASQDVCDQS